MNNISCTLVVYCKIFHISTQNGIFLGRSELITLIGSLPFIISQGNRLGITTIVSTDSIRHMMRSFVDEEQNPLLYASTYHAGDFLDPVAVAQAKAKGKANKLAVISHSNANGHKDGGTSDEKCTDGSSDLSPRTEVTSKKQMAIEGYKAQSEMIIGSLDRLITTWEERKESLIVEGVHLSLNFVVSIVKNHVADLAKRNPAVYLHLIFPWLHSFLCSRACSEVLSVSLV